MKVARVREAGYLWNQEKQTLGTWRLMEENDQETFSIVWIRKINKRKTFHL